MIIFKGFTVFLEDTFLEKPQGRGDGGGGGGGGGGQIKPPSPLPLAS